MIETTIGIVGGLITSFGGVPQIYKIVTTKSAEDLSWYMLGSWFTGLALTLTYGIMSRQIPVCVSACVSLTLTSTISGLKFWYGAGASEEETRLASIEYCSVSC